MTQREWPSADDDIALRMAQVFARQPWPGFAAAVQEYRNIEAELIAQAGKDEFRVLEIKRHIAEWILRCAARDDGQFGPFNEAWKALNALGFGNDDTKRQMSWLYADYCLSNGHYNAGLDVLEPVIAQFEPWLQSAVLKPKKRKHLENELENLKCLRDGLVAFRTGEPEVTAWLERAEARGPTPREKRQDELSTKLLWAMKKIADETAGAKFAEIDRRYRRLEMDFVDALPSEDDFFLLELKQSITSAIFASACEHGQPFEVCRNLWQALRPWDFGGHLEYKCLMIRRYVECCSNHKQSAAGLAVVETFIKELKQHIEAGTDEDMPEARYPQEVALLEKLREQLLTMPT